MENDFKAVKIDCKIHVSDHVTKCLRREDIEKILHTMGKQVRDIEKIDSIPFV